MGFLISKEYPGRFLRGEEVAAFGKAIDVTIKAIKKEKIYKQKERKELPNLIVYFEGKDRGVVLGKERAMDLVSQFGDDTDEWVGKTVTMFAEKKDIFGKTVNVIRFKQSDNMSEDEKKELSKELDSIE